MLRARYPCMRMKVGYQNERPGTQFAASRPQPDTRDPDLRIKTAI